MGLVAHVTEDTIFSKHLDSDGFSTAVSIMMRSKFYPKKKEGDKKKTKKTPKTQEEELRVD